MKRKLHLLVFVLPLFLWVNANAQNSELAVEREHTTTKIAKHSSSQIEEGVKVMSHAPLQELLNQEAVPAQDIVPCYRNNTLLGEPSRAESGWLSWATSPYSSLGNTNISTTKVWGLYNRFDVTDLTAFDVTGGYLTRVAFMPYYHSSAPTIMSDITIKVYKGGSYNGTTFDPGTEVVSQKVPGAGVSFNFDFDIKLDNPVYISGDEEIWFGVEYTFTYGYPAMADNGAYYKPGKGDITSVTNEGATSWGQVTSLLSSTSTRNWYVLGYVEDKLPEETCNITIEMDDDYGDGWGGAYLYFFDSHSKFLDNVTLLDKNATAQTISLPKTRINCYWAPASGYNDEVSFTIKDAGGEVLYRCNTGDFDQQPEGVFFAFDNTGCLEDCSFVTDLHAKVQGADVFLSWEAAEGSPTNYRIFDGDTELGVTRALTYSLTGLAGGTHVLGVEAIYANPCYPQRVTATVEIGSCETVSNLAVAYDEDCGAILTWNAPSEPPTKLELLWDQLDVGQTTSGLYAGIFTSYAPTLYYAYTADDFDVDKTWTVEQVTFQYGQTGGTSPTSGGIIIYKNAADNKPGEIIYEAKNLTTGSSFSGLTTFYLPTPCKITDPGKYWIVFYANKTGSVVDINFPLIIMGPQERGLKARLDGNIFSDIEPGDWAEVSGNSISCVFSLTGPVAQVPTYNIYRDDVLVAEGITEAFYTDTGFDPLKKHKWNVAVVCAPGVESAWAGVEKEPCSVLSTDASLLDLTVSAGTLAPAFDPDVTNYTVNVAHDVNAITITGTTTNPNSTVVGNVTNAPLATGHNVFDLVVTAENGVDTKTYTVTIIVSLRYTINATASEGGSISPSGAVHVSYGETKTFTFLPAVGYKLVRVLVNGMNNEVAVNSKSHTFFDIMGSHTIEAVFELNTFSIVSSAGEGGTIVPNGDKAVGYGSNQVYTFAPNWGYKISKVLIDGVNNETAVLNGKYTFSNVTAAHLISVEFESETHTVTATAGAGGSVYPAGAQVVAHNSHLPFSIAPNVGYEAVDVKVDGFSVGVQTAYTFNNVIKDHTIYAEFRLKSYSIIATAGHGGTISPEGTETVNYGSDQSYTITPNAGYEIADVFVDGISIGAKEAYTFNDVSDSHIIAATFKATVGIDDIDTNRLTAYPNPVSELLNVRSPEPIQNIKVFDMTGRLVHEINHVNSENANINMSGFANGIYFIDADGSVIKVIKR